MTKELTYVDHPLEIVNRLGLTPTDRSRRMARPIAAATPPGAPNILGRYSCLTLSAPIHRG